MEQFYLIAIHDLTVDNPMTNWAVRFHPNSLWPTLETNDIVSYINANWLGLTSDQPTSIISAWELLFPFKYFYLMFVFKMDLLLVGNC